MRVRRSHGTKQATDKYLLDDLSKISGWKYLASGGEVLRISRYSLLLKCPSATITDLHYMVCGVNSQGLGSWLTSEWIERVD